MKFLSWNCRGLGKPPAVRALKSLIRKNCPDLVFLSETKLKKSDTNFEANILCGHLCNYFSVDCNMDNKGRAGGLVILWSHNVNVNILSNNTRYIDCYVACVDSSYYFYASCIYGFSTHNDKFKICDIITNLSHNRVNSSWIVLSDFNLVMHNSDKLGGKIVDQHIANHFNQTLDLCDSQDLGYHGNHYT